MKPLNLVLYLLLCVSVAIQGAATSSNSSSASSSSSSSSSSEPMPIENPKTTALINLIVAEDAPAIEKLLEEDPSIVNDWGKWEAIGVLARPLCLLTYFAPTPEFVHITQLLINAGADSALPGYVHSLISILHLFATYLQDVVHDLSLLQQQALLLSKDTSSINVKDHIGHTALLRILINPDYSLNKRMQQHTKIIAFLENGADPNIADNTGTMPLMLAAKNGDNEMVAILLRYGANIKSVDKDSRDVFYYATARTHVLKILHGYVQLRDTLYTDPTLQNTGMPLAVIDLIRQYENVPAILEEAPHNE